MASHSKPPLPTKPKPPWPGMVTQNGTSKSPRMTSSGAASRPGGPAAHALTSTPDSNGPQMTSQHPTHSLAAPQAVVRPLTLPITGVSGIRAPPVMAGTSGNASDTKSSGMPYDLNAIAPATLKKHSIYPINSQGRKHVPPEPSTDPALRRRTLEEWNKASSDDIEAARERVRFQIALQNEVCREGERLQAEKKSKAHLPSGPTAGISESTNRPGRNAGHQSDIETHSTSCEKTGDTLAESTDWDNETDLDRDFTIFEDTPKDQCMVEEEEEVMYPPFNVVEPDQYPSVSALSSMKTWEPELDEAYQIDAQWSLEKWDDLRFKVPQTPADIESLQQALEMTRMDFWIRNPIDLYPADLSQYKTESYGSQQRRLQHAFCKIWQAFRRSRDTAPPELYRLPNWMFGFDERLWKPSRWGADLKSTAYNQGLADLAAAKKEKGLRSMNLRGCKAWLEEQVAAATAHCSNDLALYAGPENS